MKNIQHYNAAKYADAVYEPVAAGIYRFEEEFVTSFSFEPEPDEEKIGGLFAPYLLEDFLEQYVVYISDFYEEFQTEKCCVFEIAGDLEAVEQAREIIGKRMYHQTVIEDGQEYFELVID